MVIFVTNYFSQKMKHTIGTRWRATYQGSIHFPHNIETLYKYFIHLQSEDSHAP
jgi:hypothetical protein